MKAFFTKNLTNEIIETEVDAVDIVTEKYRIAVRISGVTVFDKTKEEEIFKQELVLEGGEQDVTGNLKTSKR